MKLIELLVKELPKRGGWPDVATCATQDKDGEVWFSYQAIPYLSSPKGAAWLGGDWINDAMFSAEVAEDRFSAIITREQYEAALAESLKHAADADGWTRWDGGEMGECPVNRGTVVDVRFRGLSESMGCQAYALRWDHQGNAGDIIAYRLHKPQEADGRANDDRLADDVKAVAPRADADGWIKWDGKNLPEMSEFVDIEYRSGLTESGRLSGWVDWSDKDIVAYRLVGSEKKAAPETVAWDGNGLPPVGCVCEANIPRRGEEIGYEWRKVKVVYTGEPGFDKEAIVFDMETTYPTWADEFRPLRTPAERQREQTVKAIMEIVHAGNGISQNIYDAIAAGKVPGIMLKPEGE